MLEQQIIMKAECLSCHSHALIQNTIPLVERLYELLCLDAPENLLK